MLLPLPQLVEKVAAGFLAFQIKKREQPKPDVNKEVFLLMREAA